MHRDRRSADPGIEVRHQKGCSSRRGKRCSCRPGYRGKVWFTEREGKGRWINGPTFPTKAQARNWRQDNQAAVRAGKLRPVSPTTVRDAGAALLVGMESGAILDRSGRKYKPSTRRSYEQALRLYVVPRLGHLRLGEVRRAHVQDFADGLRKDGLSASTVTNKLDPLRVIFRRALHRDEISVDPTVGLVLPQNTGRRSRVESPKRAIELIAALPESERALWATMIFAGLRRGEARALRASDLDLDAGVLRVERGWDDEEGAVEGKTRAATRKVPLMGELRRELVRHKLWTGRSGADLLFGRAADLPFVPSTVRARAVKAWKAAGLEPLTPHEARHCCASFYLAAGLNLKEVSTFIGHEDVRTTINRYGHLLPGGEQQSAAKLDAFFEAEGGSR
jgi:integrase